MNDGALPSSEDAELKQILAWSDSLSSLTSESLQMARIAICESLDQVEYSPLFDAKCLLGMAIGARVIPGYASLDFSHLQAVQAAVASVADYVTDTSLKRPRNFLLNAAPGAGKSHLVACIANAVGPKRVGVVSFNMATMQSKDDLISALDAARNMVVDQKIPLIFLDEFDSNPKRNYALLLPLLWDGKLELGAHTLKIGKSIFFLAGSSSEMPGLLEKAGECRPADGPADNGKIVDLMSRINGTVIRIPQFSTASNTGLPNSVADKVAIASILLRSRFRNCVRVQRSLLRFFARVGFRYSARSLTAVVNAISLNSRGNADEIEAIEDIHLETLPLDKREKLEASTLAYHLYHEDGIKGVVDLWNECRISQIEQHIYLPQSDGEFLPIAAATILETLRARAQLT